MRLAARDAPPLSDRSPSIPPRQTAASRDQEGARHRSLCTTPFQWPTRFKPRLAGRAPRPLSFASCGETNTVRVWLSMDDLSPTLPALLLARPGLDRPGRNKPVDLAVSGLLTSSGSPRDASSPRALSASVSPPGVRPRRAVPAQGEEGKGEGEKVRSFQTQCVA